jgi:acetyl esterase/lipase
MLTRRVFLQSLGVAAVSSVDSLAGGPRFETSAAHGRTVGYDPERNYNLWIYDVQYRRAGDESWLVRVYEPQGTGPFPLLLDVHGGVWTELDRHLNALTDQALAASGMVVAAIDFRQAPRDPYPASVADVNYATRWLKVHAQDFKADPRTIGGLGMSSGGHLVMLSAMRPRDARYAALPLTAPSHVDATLGYIIALYPILDPYARYLFAQQTGRADLVKQHDGYFRTLQAMQEGNPTLILSRGEKVAHPPTLLLQGTADRNVLPEMQERFAAAYRAAGGSIELVTFPDTAHGFTLRAGPATDRAIALMKAFIARQLGRIGGSRPTRAAVPRL